MGKINPVQRDLRDMIANAEAGDTSEARAVVETIRATLEHGKVGKFPLPPAMADVLIQALDAGLRGDSINKALGLTRRGRKNEWEWQAKAMSARIVQELMAHGVTLEVAAEQAAEFIAERIRARAVAFASGNIDTINQHLHEQGQAWASFQGRSPSDWDCRRWYVELTRIDK